jgi:GAF domain-containing protein
VLQRAANLIRERFDLYHVGLFLIDRSGQWAVLRASTGEKEDQMRQPGYRVKVGDTSIVGWCTANAQLCTAPTPGATSIHGHQVTPTLPEIRSEMAIPLESHGHLIGALKVQSTEREAFPEEDVAVLQMVTQQIAIAIDNTQSLAEIRSRLQAVERRTRDYAPTERPYPISTQVALSYERTDHGGIHRASATTPDELDGLGAAVAAALANRQAVVQSDSSDGREAALLTSIRLRGEALGVLGLHETDSGREWTDDEVALVEAVADQMALAIENARLLEETQGRAEREQLVGDITAKMQRANDMDMLMQNTIQELLTALNASHVAVHLGTKDQLLSRLGGDSSDQNE